ncbi:MAG: hypothetical protein ACREDP_06100, partial [Bradyrhizobium sp.]
GFTGVAGVLVVRRGVKFFSHVVPPWRYNKADRMRFRLANVKKVPIAWNFVPTAPYLSLSKSEASEIVSECLPQKTRLPAPSVLNAR